MNHVLEAQMMLGDPIGLRSEHIKGKGWDANCEMEAQMLLLKESGEYNLDYSPEGASSYRASQSNSDVDLDECLADFTKRVRLKKCNSVRKKISKLSPPKNRSPSPSKGIIQKGQEGVDVAKIVARPSSNNESSMV
ncbi:hypothetical protein Ancab_005031, partial [Ancistrocladus abbreviatus]